MRTYTFLSAGQTIEGENVTTRASKEDPGRSPGTTRLSQGARYIPPSLPLPLLARPRLLERISAATRHRLTLVHGDAGYGKTTLLVQYADLLRASGKRGAWLTLHRSDEDPLVLLGDIVGAIRRETSDFGARLLATLQRSRRLDRQLAKLAELLGEELARVDDVVVLLDDHAQLRSTTELAEFINDVIELLPSSTHLALGMRRAPQFPGLSRWRLHGEVLDVSAAELAFTRDEASSLLRGEFELELPEHAIDTIYARTGGWPAGLRLAAAFVRERGWADLAEFKGSGAELYEYFNAEVLARRSPQMTDLLMRWSLLDRVEEETARVLVGQEARYLLAELENAGLVQRDAEVGGYRFQPLFGDFLRARAREMLAASEIVELHRTFAERALERGSFDQAIYHLQHAGDYKQAAALVRDRAEELLSASEVTTLQRWLDGFPPGIEGRFPWVLLMRGVLHRIRGDYERALALYGQAEEQLRRAKDLAGLARALIWSGQVLRYLRRPREALERVRDGLATLGEGASLQGAWALHVLGGCHADLGDVQAASEAYLRADYLFGLLGHLPGQLTEAHAIAQLHAELGDLEEAQRNFLRALALQQTTGDVNILCWTQAGLTDVRARRGDIGDAPETLQQALDLARSTGQRVAQAAIWASFAYVHGLAGQFARAEEAYRVGVELCRTQGDDSILLRLHTDAAELRALRGDVAAAREALRSAEAIFGLGDIPLAAARVGIARGTVLEAEGQPSGAYAAYRAAAERARAVSGRYAETKAAILAARLDTDAARADRDLESALRTVTKERYRDLFLLRPGLVAWLRGRTGELALAPADAEALASILSPTRPSPPTERARERNEKLQVFLLGSFEVRMDGVRISDRAWRTSKAKELFALLLLERHRAHPRDALIEALWPESDAASGASNLTFSIRALQLALSSVGVRDAELLARRPDGSYQLMLPVDLQFDLELFQQSLRRANDAVRAHAKDEAAQHLRAAVAIHRGELLLDLENDWIEQRRTEVSRQFAAAARDLAALELELGNPGGAVRPLQRLLEREPYDEEAHRTLMRAYHESGETTVAIRHYQALSALLRRDLQQDPQEDTSLLYQRLRGALGRPV
jgi:LuxR family maltose regulon positive regulatory protein